MVKTVVIMVTLRKKNMLREWVCHAATDGWCADWARGAPEPKVTSVQHICEDHDEGTVHLEHQENFANTVGRRSVSPGGFRRHVFCIK